MRWLPWLIAVAAMPGLSPIAAAQTGEERIESILGRIDDIQQQLGARGSGVLGLMGYNMTPDGSANSLQISRGNAATELGSSVLTLSQLGAGFTVAESFPLWLEGYLGTARYDPRAVFTNLPPRQTPLRWNNVAATIGVGYDVRIGEYLWLRPILNLSGGFAASDAALFGSFVNYRTDRDVSALTDKHVNVWGIGGSLMLAYYDHRPARDIDVELRYTQIYLQTFGDTIQAARGTSMAKTLGLWARYRWPTGWEAFGRPVRWVLDGSFTSYLGDQEDTLGFSWAAKLGGGIEIDVGRYEVGAAGLNISRIRLVARYFIGDNNVTGTSVGIGISF
ncbi:hypothetical protein AAFN86_20055 [Roseomonas sp. CAU 1739]|uniref:hypothetical protein n=1 Tax=Roseomonas sp. CAU 1739 TaxID=3140364 RepID=UPI00325AFE83